MTYMSNQEITDFVSSMAMAIEADKHGGVRNHFFRELLKVRLIDAMPETTLDPFRPCPGDWTAIQLAWFDNGDPKEVRKRYIKGKDGKRREKIQRTTMRFGGNIKVWTRDKINFSNAKTVSWQGNFHCWTAEQARSIVRDLLDEGYIDEATVDLIDQVTAKNDPTQRFSIPLLKTTQGTRWMKGHVIGTMIGEDGLPTAASLLFPDCEPVVTLEDLADCLPNGEAFFKNVIRQARIGRNSDFGPWATEIAQQ